MGKETVAVLAFLLVSGAYTADANADDIKCRHHASHAASLASQNETLKCGFTGDRWRTDVDFHKNWCMKTLQDASNDGAAYAAAKKLVDQVDRQRIADIIECQKRVANAPPAPPQDGGAGGGNVQEICENTDLYDAREGNKIGGDDFFLAAGEKVTVVGDCGDDWCQISQPKGWAWGGHMKPAC